jgi:hypothetical protein
MLFLITAGYKAVLNNLFAFANPLNCCNPRYLRARDLKEETKPQTATLT